MNTIDRVVILNKIFAHLQMVTQWPDSHTSIRYMDKAEALIEVLESADCGSHGGHDPANPNQYLTPCMIYNRFLSVMRKYGDEDKIKPRCGASVETLTRYFTELMGLRDKVYSGG